MTDIATKLRAALAEEEPAKVLIEPSLIQSVNEVLELVHQAKSKSKSFAKGITFKVDIKETGISKTNLSRIRESQPSHEVTSFLAEVQAGTVAFWNPQFQEIYTDEQKHFLKLPLNHTLFICLVLEKNEIHHKILRRFARVVLSKLSQNGYTAASIAQDFHRIGLNTETLLEKFTQQIEAFIIGGSKYFLIADALGGPGALFFLPSEIGNMVWEKDFSKKGSNHDESIQALKVAGVHDASKDYHTLAQSLIGEGINTTVTVAQRAISWISKAPKRGLQGAGRLEGKRPRYQRSSSESRGDKAGLALQDKERTIPAEQGNGTTRQGQHLRVPSVAEPVPTFQQAAPTLHTQESHEYTTINSTGNPENNPHSLPPGHRDNIAQLFDSSHPLDQRSTPHVPNFKGDAFEQTKTIGSDGPCSENQGDATQSLPQFQIGIIAGHGNLCVPVNAAQRKAHYEDTVISSDAENGSGGFLSNPSTPLTDAESCLATLDGGMSGESSTLTQNEVPSPPGLLTDFDPQYNLFDDFLLTSFEPQHNFFGTVDFTNLNTEQP
ncbi:hypothetical protein V2W45_1323632 [Cenococcum geophilum]